MRLIALAAGVAAIITSNAAAAAEPTIDDACMRAVELTLGEGDYAADELQSFPEMNPPRTRFVVTREARSVADVLLESEGSAKSTSKRDAVGAAQCEFAASKAPFGLVSFCVADGCILGTSPERLQELQVMLEREGF